MLRKGAYGSGKDMIWLAKWEGGLASVVAMTFAGDMAFVAFLLLKGWVKDSKKKGRSRGMEEGIRMMRENEESV